MKHICTVLLGIILLQPLYAEEMNNLGFPEEFVYETTQVGPHEAEDITKLYTVGMSEDGKFTSDDSAPTIKRRYTGIR